MDKAHHWLRWKSHRRDALRTAVDLAHHDLYADSDQHPGKSKEEIATGTHKVLRKCSTSEDEDDPLPSILDLPNLDLIKMNNLEWLRTQLIGDRTEFPTPFGKRQLLYVDQAASGRSLLFIENFIIRNVLPFYGNTHTEDTFVGSRISSMVRESARYIKKRLGGSSQDALLFCGSGSTAALKRLQEVMGIAIPSTLRSRVLETMKDGDPERCVVFTGPYEHHSNLLSWRQSLAQVVEIPADSEGFVDLAVLESALKSPLYRSSRLKLGSFSACSNVTGLITDTRAIARLLHDHGAFACFDFAASAPHVDVDMRSREKDGYDAVVLSPHKFIGGPGTPGILLMSKALYLLGKNPPSTCGGGTVSYVNGFSETNTLYYEKIEEREDGGTPPIVQKIRCALAFRVKELIGNTVIEEREAFYTENAIKRLSANPNIWVLGNTTAKRAPIISFMLLSIERKFQKDGGKAERSSSKLVKSVAHGDATGKGKPLHGRFVVKLLNDLFGIQARGGCACAGPYGHTLLGVGRKQSLDLRSAIEKGYAALKPGWARLSFCYDMAEEEVEFVLAAIEVLAKYGQRFLPLYELDWRTGRWTFRNTTEKPFPFLREVEELSNMDVKLPEFPDPVRVRQKRRHYLRMAKATAHLLPKFPPPRPLPPDLPATQILFRV